MESKKKHGSAWPWWLAVTLTAVFIIYPLSIGPISWLLYEGEAPEWVATGFGYYCVPFAVVASCLPDWARVCCAKYISWWTGIPWRIVFSSDG